MISPKAELGHDGLVWGNDFTLMTSSLADDVTEHGGELLLLHLGGHLTPNAGQTEGGAQTVGAEVPLKQTNKVSHTG